ncbi:MAG: hypothetical protein ACO1OB_34065 [Archangium sp.]
MVRLSALSALCLAMGCSPLANLERPLLSRSDVGNLCGTTIALEPSNRVTVVFGCESGSKLVRPQSQASSEAADEVRRLFDAASTTVCVGDPSTEEKRALYFRAGKDEPNVHFERCKTEGPEPWTALDAAFDAL